MAKAEFHAWLRRQGAEVLAPTNPYEFARFIARGATQVIYQRANGNITATGFAGECWDAFTHGQSLNMGFKQKPRTAQTKKIHALGARDGWDCFFCLKPLDDDITIEHLVARGKGGPDHMDNLALAHSTCNTDAANLPLMKKLEIRERALRGGGS